jgi:hypothetical protein
MHWTRPTSFSFIYLLKFNISSWSRSTVESVINEIINGKFKLFSQTHCKSPINLFAGNNPKESPIFQNKGACQDRDSVQLKK